MATVQGENPKVISAGIVNAYTSVFVDEAPEKDRCLIL